jgi:hypothetical protein
MKAIQGFNNNTNPSPQGALVEPIPTLVKQ